MRIQNLGGNVQNVKTENKIQTICYKGSKNDKTAIILAKAYFRIHASMMAVIFISVSVYGMPSKVRPDRHHL